ncbi:MAG: prenyltransferase [Thaumarchaeota archaeon]|nr:prenyltransferase [Nitrososphaerota archaeon]
MQQVSLYTKVFRLSRAQFTPLIIAPTAIGISAGWFVGKSLNPLHVILVFVGVVLLQLAANIIDDVYDFQNGIDEISNKMFPPDFGGWKVIPRGLMAAKDAKLMGYGLFAISIAIGGYFGYVIGLPSLILALLGTFFGIAHAGPPFKLDYRGLALGEFGIFLSFGPIPALGSYYVMTGDLSFLPILASIPSGLLTAAVLVDHDLIFFGPYKEGGKRTLAVVLGASKAMAVSSLTAIIAYAIILFGVLSLRFPITVLLSLIILPLFIRKVSRQRKPAETPLHYVKITMTSFIFTVLFGLLVALGFLF